MEENYLHIYVLLIAISNVSCRAVTVELSTSPSLCYNRCNNNMDLCITSLHSQQDFQSLIICFQGKDICRGNCKLRHKLKQTINRLVRAMR